MSVPVAFVEAEPFVGVVVPWAVAWPPAVVPLPDIEPGCEVPVSFEDVRVFLLLLLQPKTSAAASARPDAYFMCCLLKRVVCDALLGGAARRRDVPAAWQR